MPTTTDSPVDTLLAAPEFRPRTATLDELLAPFTKEERAAYYPE